MSIRIYTDSDTVTAFLSGEIDHHEAASLRCETDLAVREHTPRRLILDFSDVSFMDSSGIGLVMGRCRIMNEIGGSVVVRGANEAVRKVMKLSGVDRLAEISSSGREDGK